MKGAWCFLEVVGSQKYELGKSIFIIPKKLLSSHSICGAELAAFSIRRSLPRTWATPSVGGGPGTGQSICSSRRHVWHLEKSFKKRKKQKGIEEETKKVVKQRH